MTFAFRFKARDFQMLNVFLKLCDSLGGLYRLAAQSIALMAQGIALNCG
jgi:hypothetical protein